MSFRLASEAEVKTVPLFSPGRLRSWPLAGSKLRLTAVILAFLGVASWVMSIPGIHPYRTGSAGLVTDLPALWWIGLVLVSTSLVIQLLEQEPRTATIAVSIVAFAVVLHGTLPAAERIPRFGAAYYIAGFTDYVGRTGTTLPHLDARMSWFGLFAGAGLTSRAMQVAPLWFLRWAPLVFELCYVLPVKALANVGLRTGRARWAAVALFLAGNWIDQDYFSPQAVGLMIYLTILVIAVRSLSTVGEQPWPIPAVLRSSPYRAAGSMVVRALRLPYGAVPGESPPEKTSPRTRAALTLAVLALGTVLVITHQASPVALCVVLFVLALSGRTLLKTAWIYFGFVVFSWLSFAGIQYWKGHLSKIFGSLGNVSSTVSVSVSGRAVSTSLGRSLVEGGRIGAAIIIWLGALAGLIFLWRRGRSLWTICVLAGAPVLIVGAVSYGGEIALRILLFSLAPLAVLAAGLLDEPRLRRGSVGAFAVTFLILIALFPLNRFGNESFEAFSPSDFASAEWVHSHVPVGSRILIFNRVEPLGYADVGDYHFTQLGAYVLDTAQQLESVLPRSASYVYLTRSQYEEGTVYLGLPKNWMQQFEANLSGFDFTQLVFSNSTARVYYLAAHPRSLPAFTPTTPKSRIEQRVPQPRPQTTRTPQTPPKIIFHLRKPAPTTTVKPKTTTPTTTARR